MKKILIAAIALLSMCMTEPLQAQTIATPTGDFRYAVDKNHFYTVLDTNVDVTDSFYAKLAGDAHTVSFQLDYRRQSGTCTNCTIALWASDQNGTPTSYKLVQRDTITSTSYTFQYDFAGNPHGHYLLIFDPNGSTITSTIKAWLLRRKHGEY